MFTMEEVAENFGAHFSEALQKYRGLGRLSGRTLIVGMGGSGMPGAFAAENARNVEVYRGYLADFNNDIGSYDNVILSSYSGSTEEVLSFARELGAFTAVACGGELEKITKEKNNPFIRLPEGFQPRAAVPYPIAAYSYLLGFDARLAGYVNDAKKADVDRTSDEILNFLQHQKVAAVCGVPGLTSTAYYLKANLNENSKMPVFYAELPEDNHNALEALSPDAPYIIFGEPKNDRIRKRAEYMAGLGGHVLWVRNDNPIELLWAAIRSSVRLAKKRSLSPDDLKRVSGLKTFLK